MRRLLPDPGETTVADTLDAYRPWEDAPADRPRTALNFAVTLDGRAAIDGRSGPIGSDTDTAMLVGLRTRFDAVMVGAGTIRAEGYGRIVSDPAKRELRERAGLSPDPLAVLVSNRLDLPWDAPIFTDGGGRILIFTASADSPPETATPLTSIRHEGAVDLVAAMRHLREAEGVRALLCEGGPTLHGQLQRERLTDELFLTIAPKLAGTAGPSLVEAVLEDPVRLELAWLMEEDGELFARYLVHGPRAPVTDSF